ncbi:MAG: serine/threonine-protein kinase PpkA [Polaribacter sp.]
MSAIEIPGYEIIKTLGVGGQATVYLAIQKGFDREVALKVMSPALAADPTFGERFIREAKIVAKLAHTRIVTVYDVGESGNFYYLAMEYMRGKELKARISNGLKTKEALSIIAKLAMALHFAHSKGYIHRDVKSENILFDDNNQPILTDFGIAKASNSSTQMTQTGKLIGTPEYMSPEQCRGKKLDGRSDLYSLGIILFEMMTGSVPFTGEDSVSICIKHVTKPVPQLPARLNKLQWIINSLLDKNPNARFQTGNELADALKEFIVTGNQTGTTGSVSRVSGGIAKTVISRVVDQSVRSDDFDDEDYELSDEFNLEQKINIAPEGKSKAGLIITIIVLLSVGAAGFHFQDQWLPKFQEFADLNSTNNPIINPNQNQKLPVSDEKIETKDSRTAKTPKNKIIIIEEKEVKNTILQDTEISTVRVSQLIQRADTLAQYTPHELKDIEQALDNLTTAKSLEPINNNVTVTRGKIIEIALAEAVTTAQASKFNAANDWVKLVEIADRDNPKLQSTKLEVLAIKTKYDSDLARREEDARNLSLYLNNGLDTFHKGRLGAPENANSIYYYAAALKIDPENEQALNGLSSVTKKYLALLEQAIKTKEFSKARRYLTSLKTIPKSATDGVNLSNLDSRVTKAKNFSLKRAKEQQRLATIAENERLAEETRQKKRANPLVRMQLNSNLQIAQQLFDEGHLVTPYGSNSLERFNAVLKIDAKDEEALLGIKKIGELIVQNLDVAISNNLKNEAVKWYDALKIYEPVDIRLVEYKTKIESIVQKPIEGVDTNDTESANEVNNLESQLRDDLIVVEGAANDNTTNEPSAIDSTDNPDSYVPVSEEPVSEEDDNLTELDPVDI